jgi:hypothetical protein
VEGTLCLEQGSRPELIAATLVTYSREWLDYSDRECLDAQLFSYGRTPWYELKDDELKRTREVNNWAPAFNDLCIINWTFNK